jgi:hypothetical protein
MKREKSPGWIRMIGFDEAEGELRDIYHIMRQKSSGSHSLGTSSGFAQSRRSMIFGPIPARFFSKSREIAHKDVQSAHPLCQWLLWWIANGF